jgi:hypothetical protein
MPPVHANHLPQQPQVQEQQQYVPNQAPSHATRPDEIVHYFKGTHPIVEGIKQTESLAGTTFVQAANLDYKGNKVLMFVFSVRVFFAPLSLCVSRRSTRRTDSRRA